MFRKHILLSSAPSAHRHCFWDMEYGFPDVPMHYIKMKSICKTYDEGFYMYYTSEVKKNITLIQNLVAKNLEYGTYYRAFCCNIQKHILLVHVQEAYQTNNLAKTDLNSSLNPTNGVFKRKHWRKIAL